MNPQEQELEPLETELKTLIINSLGMEDMSSEDIDTQAPLFGEGLGLDSIDILELELGLVLQKHFGIKIDPDKHDMREHFQSVATLARFVSQHRQPV